MRRTVYCGRGPVLLFLERASSSGRWVRHLNLGYEICHVDMSGSDMDLPSRKCRWCLTIRVQVTDTYTVDSAKYVKMGKLCGSKKARRRKIVGVVAEGCGCLQRYYR
jgi:hypothetical protein